MKAGIDAAAGPPPDFMSCSELVELVTDYFESVLPTPELVRFEEHLAACPPCRTYLAQMRRIVDAVGHLAEEQVDPAARDVLLAAFRDWKTGRQGA
jgi:anti-sigma factor RsiW